jgi:signal transduction histidine kinase
MPKWNRESWTTLAVAAVLLASLAVLATLQYRWIDEVSHAERGRLEASLTAAANRFGEDFDRELARAFHYFLIRPLRSGDGFERELAERYRLWRTGAPYPELVAGVRLADRGGAGGAPRLRRLDAESGGLDPVDWPPALEPVFTWLAAVHAPPPAPDGSPRGGSGRWPPRLLLDEAPALVVPAPGGDLVVVELDRTFLTVTFPAELAERYFAGGGGLDVDLALETRSEPPVIVYRSAPAPRAARLHPGDATVDLFGLRWFQELAVGPGPAAGGGPGGDPFGFAPPMRRPRGPRHLHGAGGGIPGFAAGPLGQPRWRLVVSHREGSLEAAVAAARQRNLALSLGVLALLVGSVGVLAASARRAQRLARQQLEFVAGVTHELHTPLAAICAAGENLADGVVAENDQVRRYGATIRDAGRRLAGLVAQALELAGMQSGRESTRREPVAMADAVDAALADCRREIEATGVAVERDLPAGLPPVAGDADALRRVFANLIGNAVKYGGAGGWVGVRARAAGGGVTVEVEDRGPGVSRRDLPHLFEPFYRGREAAAGSAAGSGIGLAVVRRIVEAHGGKVAAAARPEGGARFTVRLPAAEPRAVARGEAAAGAAEVEP